MPSPNCDRFSTDELWMLYDKVAAEVDVLDRASDVAMVDTGAQPWRELKAKLREALDA